MERDGGKDMEREGKDEGGLVVVNHGPRTRIYPSVLKLQIPRNSLPHLYEHKESNNTVKEEDEEEEDEEEMSVDIVEGPSALCPKWKTTMSCVMTAEMVKTWTSVLEYCGELVVALWAIWYEVSTFHAETTQALCSLGEEIINTILSLDRPYVSSPTPSSVPLEGSEYSSDLVGQLEEEIARIRIQEGMFPVILPASEVKNPLERAENNVGPLLGDKKMEKGSSSEKSGSGKSSGGNK
ncbi:hypothetical protein F5I97DRAFT_1831011 [Phlebopus sp. FC_14]|nr:hypothetical protein F5I97DRAFT_1831011 [Phlebopus sp. FC_14]